MNASPTRRRQAFAWPRLAIFALAGASLALFVGPNVRAQVGPLDTTLSARPALAGYTAVPLAPLATEAASR